MNPSIWHNNVSTHDWGQVSTARGQYYYIESQYFTPWCQYTWCQYTWLRPSFYCLRSVLLHWVPVSNTWSKYTSLIHASTAKGQYNYIVSKYMTHEVSTHHWDQGTTAWGQIYYIEYEYLTPKIVNKYDQEIPQSQTADNPVAPWGRVAQPSQDTRKTN